MNNEKEGISKEEAKALRWKLLSGSDEGLTEEEKNTIGMLYSQDVNPFQSNNNVFYNNSSDNSNEGLDYGRQYTKSNGKNLLEPDNKPNNLGMSNIIFLATISFVMELTFLIVSLFLFN